MSWLESADRQMASAIRAFARGDESAALSDAARARNCLSDAAGEGECSISEGLILIQDWAAALEMLRDEFVRRTGGVS